MPDLRLVEAVFKSSFGFTYVLFGALVAMQPPISNCIGVEGANRKALLLWPLHTFPM